MMALEVLPQLLRGHKQGIGQFFYSFVVDFRIMQGLANIIHKELSFGGFSDQDSHSGLIGRDEVQVECFA